MKTMAYLEVCIGQGQESNSLECSSPTGWAPCFCLAFSPESSFVLLCQSVNALPNLYRTNLDYRDVPPMVVSVILLRRQRLDFHQTLHQLQC